jgi:hypothetical protein
MTSFVHLEYSNQHPGVVRVESAIASAQKIKRHFSGARGLATLLLSAIAAAVMVVAYQVMDSMAEGQLLVLWIGLWAVAFATLAVCASTARALAANMKASLDGWSRSLAAKRADERLWAMAKTDARVMADLQCAITRGQMHNDPRDEGLRFVAPAASVAAPVVKAASNTIPSGMDLMRAYQRHYI